MLRRRNRLYLNTPEAHRDPQDRERHNRNPQRPAEPYRRQREEQQNRNKQDHRRLPASGENLTERKPAHRRKQRRPAKLQRWQPQSRFRPESWIRPGLFLGLQSSTCGPHLTTISPQRDHDYLRKTTTVSR